VDRSCRRSRVYRGCHPIADAPLRNLRIVLAAAILAAAGSARADEFFLVRDENPLIRSFYLPLPSDSRPSDGLDLSATLSISNTLNVESRTGENLLVDGESDALRLTFGDSLFESWRYRFTLPIIHDSGGFLDSAIDHYHRWFGFNPGYRPDYPHGQIIYSYSGRGDIDLTHSGTSVGDLSGELGWFPLDDAHRTLSLWGGLEAPTGSVSKLTGDGAWDGAVWAHYGLRWPTWQLAAELGVAQPFGDELFAGYAHRTSLFGRFAATRALGSLWSLRAQLDGQTGRVEDSTTRFLGPSLQLTVGAVRRFGERWRFEFGFAEDVAVNTAPDITFFFGIRRQSGAK
jgi:Protein of unknown function (DUF3187)